jgi:AcrR family transcriptional regulator
MPSRKPAPKRRARPRPTAESTGEWPRWRRRPAERRRQILDAAITVFSRRGFDGSTLAHVAREAGVSVGTVAHYFGSKADLFEEALQDHFLEAVTGAEALLASHRGTRAELLRKLLDRMWHHLMQPGTADLLLVGLVKAAAFPQACGQMCRGTSDRWRQVLASVIEAGLATGEFVRVDSVLQARVVSSGLLGLILSVRHFGRFEPNPPDPGRLLAQYLDTVDRALAARPA